MPIRLDHTTVAATDARASAEFLAAVLGLAVGEPTGPFTPIVMANGVTLDFYDADDATERGGHFAFLVSEDEFSAGLGHLEATGVTYYPGPFLTRPGEINTNDGGRGLYFLDPVGHTMELLTVPYGGWPT